MERLEVDTTRTATPGPLEAQTPAEALAEYERIIARRPAASAREARVESARARLESARSALDLARTNSRAEDWIYFGPNNPLGMRRAPRPEYQARLQHLEAEVRLAEEALREAQSG